MVQEKILAFARETGTLRRGESFAVGVSGGVDSVALLHALNAVAPTLGVRLFVAHLDHRLRGEESAADARFVADLAQRWNLPAIIEATDVAQLGRAHGLGLEAAAREARYRFFAKVVQRVGAAGVLVAHSADDQVETVLLHLLRGSGLAGLRGMTPVQRLAVRALDTGDTAPPVELTVMRPLLSVARSEIESYAAAQGLAYRIDASNEEPAFTRNRVRRELVPLLETFNPAFRGAALRMAGLLADDYAHLAREAATAWENVATVEPEVVALHLPPFLALDQALRRLVVRRAFATLAGDAVDLAAAHVDAVIQMATSGRTGSAIDLPSGVRVRRSYGRLLVSFGEIAVERLPAEGVPVHVPGLTEIDPGGWQVEAEVRRGVCAVHTGDPLHADFDLDRIGEEVVVRRRRPGDRLYPAGLGGSKKVQDILVDRKVPRWERDAVPVVTSRGRVLWVVGHAVDERARARKDTERTLHLRFRRRGATWTD